MKALLRSLLRLVQDVAYGINAGHAVRHGAPLPARRSGGRTPQGPAPVRTPVEPTAPVRPAPQPRRTAPPQPVRGLSRRAI
ncbi:hypothetical protein ABT381_01140 [Streptomyces sp. NPDC000151]|uniref:hypothetical protein n=1 Tax=Streptomyces sp. NPDC000151 TaxID=3154244 RepID=UPI0033299979